MPLFAEAFMQAFCEWCFQAPMDCKCIMSEPMEFPPMPRGGYRDQSVILNVSLLPVAVVREIQTAMYCIEPCRICGDKVPQGDEVWAGWSSCNTTRLAHSRCWGNLPGSMATRRLRKKRVKSMLKCAAYK